MPNYHFTISGSPKPEDLGQMVLATDAEALAFGRQVIREMEHRSQKKHPSRIMEIRRDDRLIKDILF